MLLGVAAVVGAAAGALALGRGERRRLRASDRRLRALGEYADEVLWVIDARSGAIDYVSPAYERIWGRDAAELRRDPRAWLAAIHPDDLPQVKQAFERTGETGRFDEEYRVVRPDGSVRWVRDRGRAVRSDDGTVVRIARLASDETAARRVLEALEARARLYRAIVESADDGVWCTDAEGITTFVNDTMARMLGWDPGAMIGRPAVEFVDSESGATASRGLEGRGSGARERHDGAFRCKDGTTLRARVTAGPLYDDAGRYLGSLGIVSDRNAEGDAAAACRRAEERTREDRGVESLSALAGGIAHDFNNLLVAIVGNASLATARLDSGSPLRPILREIEQAGAKAAALTQELLLYAGRGTRATSAVDLSALVRETRDLLHGSVGPDATLAFEFAEGLPQVAADPRQLRHVLMNLVANAREALEGGPGEIVVRTGERSLDEGDLAGLRFGGERAPGRYAYFEVEDTGVGMAEAVRARAFDPFFTTRFTGRGVGLAAVAGVVRAHGGAIELRSEPDRGTTVRVYFPEGAADPTPARVPAPVSGASPPSAARILVVDDDDAVRGVARSILAAQGFHVETAPDGASALAALEDGPPIDLILLDLTMPGMSGVDVLACLARAGREVPVLLMSGYAVDARADSVAYPGLRGFVDKPFRLGDLTDAVRRALADGESGGS